MCELFGFTARNTRNMADYLKLFAGHSWAHPHGWGVAVRYGKTMAAMKEPVKADESAILNALTSQELNTNLMMGHIRYATVGQVGYTNCHPYVHTDRSGREWFFTHNGTIFEEQKTAMYSHKQMGTTDSERLLLYLMDCINLRIDEIGMLDSRENFRILEQRITEMSFHNKLNLMAYDGKTLFVHTNMLGTLFYKNLDDGVLFCSSPLDEDGWIQVPMCQLLGYQDGIRVMESRLRSEEYVFTKNDELRLYQIFSEL